MENNFKKYFEGKSILSFFSHPDDETLAAGATINKLTALGCRVSIAIPNTGIYSRINVSEAKKKELLDDLREDTFNALSNIGIKKKDIIFGNFPDNAIDKLCLLDLVHWLEEIIDELKPDIIFTHHRFCTNIDHQYCHEAAIVACRPDVSKHIDIICGEIPSSTGYLRPTNWEPNLFVEISNEDLDSKVNSMLRYKGESRPDPHPRSPEVLRALAKVRGSESGFFFAEAFMTNKIFL